MSFLGTCKLKKSLSQPKKKEEKEISKKIDKSIINNKRFIKEPDIEIHDTEIHDNKKTPKFSNETEIKFASYRLMLKNTSRVQGQNFFLVLEALATSVFDIVYAIINR